MFLDDRLFASNMIQYVSSATVVNTIGRQRPWLGLFITYRYRQAVTWRAHFDGSCLNAFIKALVKGRDKRNDDGNLRVGKVPKLLDICQLKDE